MRKYEYFDIKTMTHQLRWFDIYLYGSNEPYILETGSVLETVRDAHDGDWKTAMVHHIPPVPAGTQVVVKNIFQNFEGIWIEAYYNDRLYSIAPRDLKYVRLHEYD